MQCDTADPTISLIISQTALYVCRNASSHVQIVSDMYLKIVLIPNPALLNVGDATEILKLVNCFVEFQTLS